MKKGAVTILAVAIIGALGIYNSGHKTNASTAAQPANTAAATTADNGSAATSTTSTPTASSNNGSYKDGTYTGAAEDTPYGMVEVAAVIRGGRITNIEFLQMPGPEGHSREITAFAEDPLKQSALNKQSAHIDFVSGATTTSEAYELSLQAALDKAA